MLKYSENYPYPIRLVSDGVIRKTCNSYSRAYTKKVSDLINHFIENPSDIVVPVYSFNVDVLRCDTTREYDELDEDDALYHAEYSYDMKRLCILSEEEKKVIRASLKTLHTDLEYYSDVIIEAKKDYPKLVEFMSEVMFQDLYWDLHDGNFLKDEIGDYKIVDLEGFRPFELWNKRGKRY